MARTGIMLCYPFEEKRLSKWNSPYIVQPKLDGERCRYLRCGDSSLLLTSQENPIFSVPHIKNFLDRIPGLPELDGELYCHGMPFEEIHSRVSREINQHQDYKDIEYHLFDIITPEPQMARTIRLSNMRDLFKGSPVKVVDYYVASTLDDIMLTYDQILTGGYEGIVVREINAPYVRKRSTSMMKFKPKKHDEYEIIGYAEEVSIHGYSKGRLGALTCQGDDGTRFNVGTGFSAEDRSKLWEDPDLLVGKKVLISYQHITHGGGVPRFPVFVKVL